MQKGSLYIVSTPIGNIEDITVRALKVLKTVDIIAAEDTRYTKRLLSFYKITTPLTSYNQFTGLKKERNLINSIKDGKSIALVSNAGTPGISDPGYSIILYAINLNVKVIPVPGPSALISSLVVSGLPLHNFLFLGFLSPKSGRRKKELEMVKTVPYTIVFFESPYRLFNALSDMKLILGDRNIAVVREITKLYEETVRGKLSDVISHFSSNKPRGEFCIVIEGFRR